MVYIRIDDLLSTLSTGTCIGHDLTTQTLIPIYVYTALHATEKKPINSH